MYVIPSYGITENFKDTSTCDIVCLTYPDCITVKLGDKDRFDKEQIGVKESFPVSKCQFLHKDKEHLALRNNFWVTKKFLITKFDCTYKNRFFGK